MYHIRRYCAFICAAFAVIVATAAAPMLAYASEAFPDPVASPEQVAALRGEAPAFVGLTRQRVEQFQTRRHSRLLDHAVNVASTAETAAGSVYIN